MSNNQRKFPRFDAQIDVIVEFEETTPLQSNTRDISIGGMYIATDHPELYPLGEMVQVHFKDPIHDNADTTKDAVVVRVSEDGIAVAFVELDDF